MSVGRLKGGRDLGFQEKKKIRKRAGKSTISWNIEARGDIPSPIRRLEMVVGRRTKAWSRLRVCDRGDTSEECRVGAHGGVRRALGEWKDAYKDSG